MTTEWDLLAPTYDAAPDHGLRDSRCRSAWSDLLRTLLPASGAAADLGCGTGTLTRILLDHGYRVDGVDLSAAMLSIARRKAPRATFHHADAGAAPLPPGSYDLVLSRHVLWTMDSPVRALAHWIGLLRPGGRLVLIEGRWSTGSGLTSAETESLVRSCGLAPAVQMLSDPIYWGGPIEDERYLCTALKP